MPLSPVNRPTASYMEDADPRFAESDSNGRLPTALVPGPSGKVPVLGLS